VAESPGSARGGTGAAGGMGMDGLGAHDPNTHQSALPSPAKVAVAASARNAPGARRVRFAMLPVLLSFAQAVKPCGPWTAGG